MITRDIHFGRPTVETAIYQLDLAIRDAKVRKEKIIEIIVGYGSTGGTHKIKTAVIDLLKIYKEAGKVKDFIQGVEVDIFNSNYQNFIVKDLIPKEEHIKKNRGSIFIAL